MSAGRKPDFFSEMVVGLFMLAVFALLAYFTIVISGVDVFRSRKTVDVTLKFPDAGGLKERDNVVYRGTKVGTVGAIELGPDGVTVTAHVSGDVVLRKGFRASIESLSLLGGNYLLLEEGAGEPLPLEGTVFSGERPSDWMRELGSIARNLNDATSGDGIRSIVTNLQSFAERANTIAGRLERGEGSLGKLLSTNDTAYADLASTLSSASTIAKRLENGEGALGKLLSTNDTVYADLASTLSSASTIAKRLENGEGTLGKLLSTNDTVFADLQKSVANIETITGRMVEGTGTLGKLSKEEGLYDDASGLLKDARQVLDNYRDTTPISTFGSLILGGL